MVVEKLLGQATPVIIAGAEKKDGSHHRRNNMWLRGRRRLARLAQNVRPQRQRLAQPDGVLDMIGVGVAGAGVEQNAQALTIEHQPRQKRAQQRGRESKLISGFMTKTKPDFGGLW